MSDDVARMAPAGSETTRSALVIGGTGPSGPDVVRGLVERGFETTIFHSGHHEVELAAEVRHIHGDPHFPQTIIEALGDSAYDVVVAQYGRLRWIAEHFVGRAGHLVAIGGANSPLAPPTDPRWGSLGRPAVVREDERHLRTDAEDDTLGFKIAEAARSLLAAGAAGGYKATYISYPTLYGPRQPGSPEWSIVRRLLDGRRRLVLPDGGLKLESRAFVRNVGLAPLLAVDNPDVADGKSYVVTDRNEFTMQQRIDFIARCLGVEVDLVEMPYALATPAHALYRRGPGHRVICGDRIRTELGYREWYDAEAALRQTVDWLVAASREEVAEIESQLGDSFDYHFEDTLIGWWDRLRADVPKPDKAYSYSHVYRHPVTPGDDWRTVDPR
jgi:nucleoside-diphosphate-sugar epimerase